MNGKCAMDNINEYIHVIGLIFLGLLLIIVVIYFYNNVINKHTDIVEKYASIVNTKGSAEMDETNNYYNNNDFNTYNGDEITTFETDDGDGLINLRRCQVYFTGEPNDKIAYKLQWFVINENIINDGIVKYPEKFVKLDNYKYSNLHNLFTEIVNDETIGPEALSKLDNKISTKYKKSNKLKVFGFKFGENLSFVKQRGVLYGYQINYLEKKPISIYNYINVEGKNGKQYYFMPYISKNDKIINKCRYDNTNKKYEKACGYIFEDGWKEIASTSIKNADGTYTTSVYPKKIYNQGYTKYDNKNHPELQNLMTSCFKTKNEDGTKISFKYDNNGLLKYDYSGKDPANTLNLTTFGYNGKDFEGIQGEYVNMTFENVDDTYNNYQNILNGICSLKYNKIKNNANLDEDTKYIKFELNNNNQITAVKYVKINMDQTDFIERYDDIPTLIQDAAFGITFEKKENNYLVFKVFKNLEIPKIKDAILYKFSYNYLCNDKIRSYSNMNVDLELKNLIEPLAETYKYSNRKLKIMIPDLLDNIQISGFVLPPGANPVDQKYALKNYLDDLKNKQIELIKNNYMVLDLTNSIQNPQLKDYAKSTIEKFTTLHPENYVSEKDARYTSIDTLTRIKKNWEKKLIEQENKMVTDLRKGLQEILKLSKGTLTDVYGGSISHTSIPFPFLSGYYIESQEFTGVYSPIAKYGDIKAIENNTPLKFSVGGYFTPLGPGIDIREWNNIKNNWTGKGDISVDRTEKKMVRRENPPKTCWGYTPSWHYNRIGQGDHRHRWMGWKHNNWSGWRRRRHGEYGYGKRYNACYAGHGWYSQEPAINLYQTYLQGNVNRVRSPKTGIRESDGAKYDGHNTTTYLHSASASGRNRAERYAQAYETYFIAPKTGRYEWKTSSDDGSYLYMTQIIPPPKDDNKLKTRTEIVNNGRLHGQKQVIGAYKPYLQKGNLYKIEATFVEHTGADQMDISFRVQGDSNWITTIKSSEETFAYYYTGYDTTGTVSEKYDSIKWIRLADGSFYAKIKLKDELLKYEKAKIDLNNILFTERKLPNLKGTLSSTEWHYLNTDFASNGDVAEEDKYYDYYIKGNEKMLEFKIKQNLTAIQDKMHYYQYNTNDVPEYIDMMSGHYDIIKDKKYYNISDNKITTSIPDSLEIGPWEFKRYVIAGYIFLDAGHYKFYVENDLDTSVIHKDNKFILHATDSKNIAISQKRGKFDVKIFNSGFYRYSYNCYIQNTTTEEIKTIGKRETAYDIFITILSKDISNINKTIEFIPLLFGNGWLNKHSNKIVLIDILNKIHSINLSNQNKGNYISIPTFQEYRIERDETTETYNAGELDDKTYIGMSELAKDGSRVTPFEILIKEYISTYYNETLCGILLEEFKNHVETLNYIVSTDIDVRGITIKPNFKLYCDWEGFHSDESGNRCELVKHKMNQYLFAGQNIHNFFEQGKHIFTGIKNLGNFCNSVKPTTPTAQQDPGIIENFYIYDPKKLIESKGVPVDGIGLLGNKDSSRYELHKKELSKPDYEKGRKILGSYLLNRDDHYYTKGIEKNISHIDSIIKKKQSEMQEQITVIQNAYNVLISSILLKIDYKSYFPNEYTIKYKNNANVEDVVKDSEITLFPTSSYDKFITYEKISDIKDRTVDRDNINNYKYSYKTRENAIKSVYILESSVTKVVDEKSANVLLQST
jgi:hypothetical protein